MSDAGTGRGGINLGPLHADTAALPQLDLGQYIPSFMSRPRTQPILPNQPRALTALTNKYSGYFKQLAESGQFDPSIIEAMRRYDANRVRTGQSPLSEDETRNALQAAQQNSPVTKPADRSMIDVPGNFISDLGDMIKSIPRIPGALINEVRELPKIGEAISSAPNPIVGLANAPGIRMLPGAFTIGNIASGTPGELARHPLFTALDLLPGAEVLAKGTRVATEATRLSEGVAKGTLELPAREARIVGKQARRPITTAMLNRLDPEGIIERNSFGELVDKIAQSRPGQTLAQSFSQGARDVMFIVNNATQKTRGIMTGQIAAKDAMEMIGRDAVRVAEELNKIDPTITENAGEFYRRITLDDMEGAPETWKLGREKIREMNTRMGMEMNEQALLGHFNNEYYDVPTAKKLIRRDQAVKQSEKFNALRNDVLSGQADPVQLAARLLDDLRTSKGGAAFNVHRKATMRQLRNAGYDTTALEEVWTGTQGTGKGKRITATTADYEQALGDVASGTTKLPTVQGKLMNLQELVEYLKGHKGEDTTAGTAKILAGVKNGEWKTVTEGLDQVRRSKSVALTDPTFVRSVRELRETARLLDEDLAPYSDARHAQAVKKFERQKANAIPARFIPVAAEKAKQELIHRLIPVADGMQAAEVIRLANQGMWTDIPNFTPRMLRKIEIETTRAWQAMREEGLDPTFVHTVPPNKATQALNPMEAIVPKTPTSIKKRLFDMAPAEQNVTVALTHQALEILSKRHVELAIKQIAEQYGVREVELRAQYAPAAQNAAERNTALDFKGHLQVMMNKSWKRFDPELEGYNWGSPYLKKLAEDEVWIPKTAYNNLKLLAQPKQILGGIMDPITGLFRMATTTLSIRNQIYNLLGGGIGLEMHQPGALIRSGGKAREMLRNPDTMPEALKTVVGQAKHTLLDMDRESLGILNEGVYAHLKGKMLKRFWDAEQQNKAPKLGQPIKRFGDGIKGLVEKSYNLNGTVDDFYRTTAYIDAYDSAIKKGYTAKAAEEAAVTSTRTILQDWMGMTPMERTVMKSIFPFYTFMSHAMRFVLRYPFDHPLRAELLSKMAMAELEDQGSLPSRFLSMMFFGGTGAAGERNAINLGPFNPFGDVANSMTINGLLGNTNPLIATALQMAGVENGEAELYPSLRYDPETGRLSAAHGNPLMALLGNTIPQSNILTSILGLNSEYTDMLRRDPAAATRFLASSLTIPIPWRNIKINEEVFKAETARGTAQEKVKNEALRSGDWNEALMYPSLREYLAALDALPDEQLAPYRQTNEAIEGATVPGAQDTTKGQASLDDLVKAYMDQINPQSLPMMQGGGQGTGQSTGPIDAPGSVAPGASLRQTAGGI